MVDPDCRLVELHRPLAYHVDPALPPHTFRNGDPVRIEEHVTATKAKGKKKESDDDTGVEGVVYKVSCGKPTADLRWDPTRSLLLSEKARTLNCRSV